MHFIEFIERLKTNNNNALIETITEGYSLIFEASVEDIHKTYYSDIDKDEFLKINKTDPTSNGGTKKGKFLPWLIKMRKSGKLKLEDLYKASEYLTAFAKYRNKLSQNDINKIQSIPELYNIVKPALQEDDQDKPDELKSKNEIKNEIKNETIKHYEDQDLLILTPKTHRAACIYGKGTQWCTASKNSSRMFDQYNAEGPLYIVIDKNDTDERYQFHPESDQFMDINDSPIEELPDILADNNEAIKSIAHVLIKFLDQEQIKEFFTHDQLVEAMNTNLKYYYDHRNIVNFDELDHNKIAQRYNVQDVITIDNTEYFVIDTQGNDSVIEMLKENDIVSFSEHEIYEWFMDNDYNLKDDSYVDLTDLTENTIKAIATTFNINPQDMPKAFNEWDEGNLADAYEVIADAYRQYSTLNHEANYIDELLKTVEYGSDKFKVILHNGQYVLLGDIREIIEDEDSYNYDNDFQMPRVDIDTDIESGYPNRNNELFNEVILEKISEL